MPNHKYLTSQRANIITPTAVLLHYSHPHQGDCQSQQEVGRYLTIIRAAKFTCNDTANQWQAKLVLTLQQD